MQNGSDRLPLAVLSLVCRMGSREVLFWGWGIGIQKGIGPEGQGVKLHKALFG